MKLLKDYRVLFLLLIIPYIFVLNLPYVGEEANWVIPSFEMSYFKEYVLQTIYKVPYYRPPLFNYPTIIFSKLLGWEYAKAIQRLQT
ncbi:MAG: ArnT family glycosyltransferase, partial [Hydrogenobaculum sp.]